MEDKVPRRGQRASTERMKIILDNLSEITKLISKGYTEKSIAKKYGMSSETFSAYKKRFPELKEAIQQGRQKDIKLVQDALLKKAKGYTTTETTVIERETKDGIMKETKVTKKYVAPSTNAIIFYLTNVEPDIWKTKRSDDTTTVIISDTQNLTPDELIEKIKKLRELTGEEHLELEEKAEDEVE